MHLAIENEELGTVGDIARRYNVSQNHLVKVVHRLVILGYLRSVRGRGGGIELAKAPEKINVGKVVRQMENTLEPIDCEGSACPLTPSCLLKKALNEAAKSFVKVLDEYTLADLVKNKAQILRLIN